jgi:hypothetical protein
MSGDICNSLEALPGYLAFPDEPTPPAGAGSLTVDPVRVDAPPVVARETVEAGGDICFSLCELPYWAFQNESRLG